MTVVDDAGSRLAAIDPARSCIVQAPAGSGKTELLIQRFLALLGTVRAPGEILAITFTRKAAGEMRTRLLQALATAPEAEPATPHQRLTRELALAVLARDRELGWRLQETPSLLSIQTIDSFNASLVRKMPWISRFGGMPEIADDPAVLYREAARRTLSRIEGEGRGRAEVSIVLAHLDNRLDSLREMLVSMLQRRDQWLRHLVGRRGEVQRQLLEKSLRSVVEEHLAQALGALSGDLREPLASLARYAGDNLAAEGKTGPASRLAGLGAFPSPRAEDLPAWKGIAELLLTAERPGAPAGQPEQRFSARKSGTGSRGQKAHGGNAPVVWPAKRVSPGSWAWSGGCPKRPIPTSSGRSSKPWWNCWSWPSPNSGSFSGRRDRSISPKSP